MSFIPICPQCHSNRLVSKHVGRKVGASVGAAAGFASSLSGAVGGAADCGGSGARRQAG